MGIVGRFGVEAARRQGAGRLLFGGGAVAEVPDARDHHGSAIVAVRMGGNTRVRRHLDRDRVKTGLDRISLEQSRLDRG